jgi:hypothetical protein
MPFGGEKHLLSRREERRGEFESSGRGRRGRDLVELEKEDVMSDAFQD